MNWPNVFLPLAFGIVFFSLGIAFLYLRYRIKGDISFYKFSRSILLLVMFLWCVFIVLSDYFHIPFYFVVVFIPIIAVIVFFYSLFISHKKEGKLFHLLNKKLKDALCFLTIAGLVVDTLVSV